MFSFIKKPIQRKQNIIRLVAIAKDEAAYLPMWIFHHFQFGFNEIEIYVNNTTDNTLSVLDKIGRKYPVKYILADSFFKKAKCKNFQEYAYDFAHRKAKKEAVSHIIFLDIDEFWTPLDYKSSIHDCISELGDADVISFEWVLKRNEEEPFSFPFSYTNKVNKNHHVKSLFKVLLNIEKIGIHNVLAKRAENLLADGTLHPIPFNYAVDDYHINYSPIKKYFILHRLWRSQIEYVSLLGQGMGQTYQPDKNKNNFGFKNNRDGYLLPENRITVLDLDKNLIDLSEVKYKKFIKACNLESCLMDSYLFVLNRYFLVKQRIIDNKMQELVKKIITNIDSEVLEKEEGKVKILTDNELL